MSFLQTLSSHYRKDSPWKQKAWDILQTKGFPTGKWEGFRHVPLQSLYESRFSPLDRPNLPIKRKKNTCVFVNGEFRAEFSQIEGVVCLPLNKAMNSYGTLLQKSWSQLLMEETNPFHLLNYALHSTGLFLYIPPHIHSTIEWLFFFTKKSQIHSPKIEVYIGKGAHLTIRSKVQGRKGCWHNESVTFSLNDEAHLCLEERLSHSDESWGFHTKRVQVKRNAKFQYKAISKGAKVERHDIAVTLEEEGGEIDVKGLSLVSGNAKIYHYLCINHEKPHTCSKQHYKTVLQGCSLSNFEGKICVKRGAQKVKACQLNNNLLLSPTARVMSKPNLEIKADDVKVSHGATCAQIHDEEIFYLKSRGLNEQEAKHNLIKGFCLELFSDEVFDESF